MNNHSIGRPFDVLLVEDNPGDVRLIEEALKGDLPRKRLHVTSDGEEAMAFLRREGRFENAPRPDIVLLDLNLPRKDGREVLAEVKADPGLMTIPVVVLTSSDAERDVMQCYRSHTNCYVTKPMELDRFIEVLRMVQAFWLGTAKLPVEDR